MKVRQTMVIFLTAAIFMSDKVPADISYLSICQRWLQGDEVTMTGALGDLLGLLDQEQEQERVRPPMAGVPLLHLGHDGHQGLQHLLHRRWHQLLPQPLHLRHQLLLQGHHLAGQPRLGHRHSALHHGSLPPQPLPQPLRPELPPPAPDHSSSHQHRPSYWHTPPHQPPDKVKLSYQTTEPTKCNTFRAVTVQEANTRVGQRRSFLGPSLRSDNRPEASHHTWPYQINILIKSQVPLAVGPVQRQYIWFLWTKAGLPVCCSF